MPQAVLSAEAVRRLAIKGIQVKASNRLGFQLIKYPDGHKHEIPERIGGVAMFEYIGFYRVTAQNLWLTYKSQNQGHGYDLFVFAKNYLILKFEKYRQYSLQKLLAAVGLSSALTSSLTNYLQKLKINDQFGLNIVSVHNLRDWAIMKVKKYYDRMKLLDTQVLNHSTLRTVSLGMFPLSLKDNVARGQMVGNTGIPVADGFYEGKDGRVVPGWKAPPYKMLPNKVLPNNVLSKKVLPNNVLPNNMLPNNMIQGQWCLLFR